jgi:hypothetical protein
MLKKLYRGILARQIYIQAKSRFWREAMTGIQYVTGEEGRLIAVQIDLRQHSELWEEIEGVLISKSRRNEESNLWSRSMRNRRRNQNSGSDTHCPRREVYLWRTAVI